MFPIIESFNSNRIDREYAENRKKWEPLYEVTHRVGGGGGIRTHGELPHAGFQDRCLKPLGHPSVSRPTSLYLSKRCPTRAT